MKHLAGVLLAFALLFGGGMLAVEVFEDRQTFVAGPDSTAEAFVREVLARRWDRAKEYLADPDSVSNEDLEQLQQRLGDVQHVEAETTEQHTMRAKVDVKLREQRFDLPLVWEKGAWRVDALPRP